MSALSLGAFSPVLLASEPVPSKAKRLAPEIVVLMPGQVPYFDAQIAGMNAQAAGKDVTLKYLFANWNASEQIRQIEYTLSTPANGIAICAVDSHALRALPELLKRGHRKLPVVSFTNGIGDNPKGVFSGVSAYVGRDEVESGRLLGEMISRTLPPREAARILLVEGPPGTTPQRLRTQGLEEFAARQQGWRIIHRFAVPGWSGSATEKQLYRLAHLDANVVATQWADAGAAAARAMLRRPQRIPIVSLEYTRDLRPHLLSGQVAMTTHHDVEREGHLVVSTMLDALQGRLTAPWVPIEQRIVNAELARSLAPGW